MLHPLRATARLIDQKIGWNKIGLALSLVIIISAGVVLYRMLRGINFSDVMVALKATERRDVILAAAFVAAGYFTLTFYDLFAVRTIGANHIPYRVAALAGFTSYSVGHNVGASVFTGGAVRYRVYSAWGLTAIDVAKICFIAGLTFWLGNVAVLGLGIAYEPEAASAIDQLPPWINRIIAFAALGVLAGYVAWVWIKPRVIGRADWVVTLPGGPLTLLQIGIGIVDLSFCALAMYVLLPDAPQIDFIKLAVIFVSATLARLCQPFARRARRVRCRDAGRADRISPGRAARGAAAVPASLLYHSVRALACYPRRARIVARCRCKDMKQR